MKIVCVHFHSHDAFVQFDYFLIKMPGLPLLDLPPTLLERIITKVLFPSIIFLY